MKQRVAVRAIIKKDRKTLLAKRANGRETILGKYELPGGKVSYREQPDDAMRRYIRNDLGASTQTVQLFDVLTYVDSDHRDIQYVLIVYLVKLQSNNSIKLSDNYSDVSWRKMADIRQDNVTESSKLLLGISHNSNNEIDATDEKVVEDTINNDTVIYSDGGSRGNPGPSAAGYVVMNANQEIIDQGGVYLGVTTNNQAEYHGVRIGLERALELGIVRVDFRIDSMLVVNQMNGIYKIKNRDLWPINERIRELAAKFEKVKFTHVKREFNQLADSMVNKTLDAHRDKIEA